MKPILLSTFLTGFLLVFINQSSTFTIKPRLECSGIPADIVFVLDSSSSIWGPHFQKQLDFVSYLVNQLDIGMGPEQVRVGVEIFSDSAHVKIQLDESVDKNTLTGKINQISRLLGSTNTAKALNQMRQTMFKPERGSRPGVKHVALILTDGASDNPAATQLAAKACRDENIQLFAIGIGHAISLTELVGIASEPKDKFFIRTHNYDTLKQIRDEVSQRTCYAVVATQPPPTTTTVASTSSTQSPTTTTTTTTTTPITKTTTPIPQTTNEPTSTSLPESTSTEKTTFIPSTTTTPTITTEPLLTTTTTTPSTTTIPTTHSSIPTTDWLRPADDSQDKRACKNKVADVFFLLDSSSSIQINEFKKQINAIEDIVTKFDIGSTKTRVGVSVFTHKYHPILNFHSGADKIETLKKIANIKYVGGGTMTGNALYQVRSDVFNQASIRPRAERILIVFTDGMSIDYERTSAEAKLLQESGVKIFVVGIGPDVDQAELQDIASKPSNEFVHNFASFDILLTKSGLLTYKACTVNDQTFKNDKNACKSALSTDMVFLVSNNRFGQEKTERILKASTGVIKNIGNGAAFRYGTIFDDCPPTKDMSIGSITEPSRLIKEIANFKYSSLASLLGKLKHTTFPSGSWNKRQLGLLFLDNTIDLNDPQILAQARRALFENIQLYVVVIGDGVDINRVQKILAPRERIINVYSYETLPSYLPFMVAKRLCAARQTHEGMKPSLA